MPRGPPHTPGDSDAQHDVLKDEIHPWWCHHDSTRPQLCHDPLAGLRAVHAARRGLGRVDRFFEATGPLPEPARVLLRRCLLHVTILADVARVTG